MIKMKKEKNNLIVYLTPKDIETLLRVLGYVQESVVINGEINECWSPEVNFIKRFYKKYHDCLNEKD